MYRASGALFSEGVGGRGGWEGGQSGTLALDLALGPFKLIPLGGAVIPFLYRRKQKLENLPPKLTLFVRCPIYTHSVPIPPPTRHLHRSFPMLALPTPPTQSSPSPHPSALTSSAHAHPLLAAP